MGKYLFKVLLAVVFSACIIWFGLPLLKAHAPGAYNHLTRFFLKNVKIEKVVANIVTKAEQAFNTVTPSHAFSSTPPTDRVGNDSLLSMKENKKTSSMSLISPPATQSVVRNPGAPTRIEEQGRGKEDPLSALNKDPGYGWAIVVTNSFVYDTEMKRIGIFSGGSIVSRKRSELKMHGYVSECFYLKERKWEPETVLIYEADLVMFDSTYEEANIEKRNLLIKYCRTLAQYEEKRAEAYKKALRENPHFDDYKNAIENYNEFFRKWNAAKAALPQSVGIARSKLMDELRIYRAEEPLVVKHFKETKERYDAWKTEHLESEKNLKIQKTIEILNLETALEAMRPRVQEIVPGL